MIADNRPGAGLGPGTPLVQDKALYFSGVLIYSSSGVIDFSVSVETTVSVFRPELAHERMRISEVYRPVSRPGHRYAACVSVIVGLGKLVLGDNVNVASVVF